MGRLDESWVVDNPPSERYPLYTRANVGEVFPEPVTPLTWTIGGRPGAEQGWRDAYETFGVFDRSEYNPDEIEILGVFGGYCYLNVTISRIFGVRVPGLTPELIDYTFFGEQPGVPPYQPQPTDESPKHSEASGATLGWILTAEDLPDLLDDQQAMEQLRAERPDVTTMSNEELVARTKEIFATWFRPLFARHILITYSATVPAGIIGGVAAAIGDPTLPNRLMGGLGGVDSAAPSWAMWDLGRMVAASPTLTAAFDAGVDGLCDRLRGAGGDADKFLTAFDDFLYRFGSRGPNEWEMRSPSWETHPDLALAAIDRMRLTAEGESPAAHHERMSAEREELGAAVTEQLAADPETQGQFAAALRAATVFMPGRERTKTTVIRMVHEARMPMRELGRRMVEAGHFDEIGDFALLTGDEYDRFLVDPGSFTETIRERRAWYDELAQLEPPFIVDGTPSMPSTWSRRDALDVTKAKKGDVLTGLPGCPGTATGRARVVLDPFHPEGLEPGDVLVAPITDPSWTPLFVPAAAVVVDVGAQLSHAIIVSRELGIPCVVSVTGGTRSIPDGATVTVDGSNGTVTVQ